MSLYNLADHLKNWYRLISTIVEERRYLKACIQKKHSTLYNLLYRGAIKIIKITLRLIKHQWPSSCACLAASVSTVSHEP
jgi:hypothetical protein